MNRVAASLGGLSNEPSTKRVVRAEKCMRRTIYHVMLGQQTDIKYLAFNDKIEESRSPEVNAFSLRMCVCVCAMCIERAAQWGCDYKIAQQLYRFIGWTIAAANDTNSIKKWVEKCSARQKLLVCSVFAADTLTTIDRSTMTTRT